MGKQWKHWLTLFWGAAKSLQMVSAAMKLKDIKMTNLESISKSRDITLSTKVHLVKAIVFPVVMYGGVSFSFSSVSQSYPTLHDPVDHSTPASLSITSSQSLLKLISTESVMPSSHLILCCPLLLLPSIFPSIRVSIYSKYWGFSQYLASKELACQCRRCEMLVLSLG